ncbi:hypothetical protein G4H71_15315 [Rhodococcus triatomae]|uniref:PASTA domain-containing protein n=1 Tax=Rhodococcus triatomae TaxID=300028 RepID=A0A1G8IYZ5_9NOCA|nr:PASTA domain-containing protein [Rhodococcus triatomae]QNG19866.1 hypothetical protein G4H72_15055 [Rhodococcus triatomae]QNG24218.1 hypothetical protein G4H71_15315 [Rhodococcus triatomae]SDI24076.1 hypothetical protein SAMN05444695_1068 [Rhodococcus triatomae]
MNLIVPYLRVVAGFFAGICTWLVFTTLAEGDFGAALIQLLFAAGLWYLAVGKLLRDRHARVKAEKEAIAARADAGHAAFLAGDTAGYMAPPPEVPEKRPMRKGLVAASVVAGVFVLVGIIGDVTGREESETEPSATSTTAPATVAAAPEPNPQASGPAQQGRAPATSSEPSLTSAVAPIPALMPDVMCMDLQEAQNLIQETGAFYSRSEDATGRGRSQIIDSNWVVVGQDPQPGAPIGEGDAMLSVVKDGERGDCS